MLLESNYYNVDKTVSPSRFSRIAGDLTASCRSSSVNSFSSRQATRDNLDLLSYFNIRKNLALEVFF